MLSIEVRIVPSVPVYTRTHSLETIHTAFVGIVSGLLFPEFGAELPLDNCTPTIMLYNHVDINIESNRKPNRLNFLHPQSGYKVRIKAFHILNAHPFCDVFISLLKRVFNSKHAARVSDFNRLHFLPVLSLAVSISIHSFHWESNIFFFFFFFFFFSSSSSSFLLLLLFYFFLCPKLTKSTDIYLFIQDSTVLVVKSCWLEITYSRFK